MNPRDIAGNAEGEEESCRNSGGRFVIKVHIARAGSNGDKRNHGIFTCITLRTKPFPVTVDAIESSPNAHL